MEGPRGGGGGGSRVPFGGGGLAPPSYTSPSGPPSEEEVWVAAVRDPAFGVLRESSEALCDAFLRGKLQSCSLDMRAAADDSQPYEDPSAEREEMENFATLARATAPVTLGTLCSLIESARSRLKKAAFDAARAAAAGSAASGPTAEGRDRESLELDVVHESLFWLVTMAGYALADSDGSGTYHRGEIPPLLNALSRHAAKSARSAAKAAAGPDAHPSVYGPKAEKHAISQDPVARLGILCLATAGGETTRAEQGGAAQSTASPVLASRCLWFLRRWVAAYVCSRSEEGGAGGRGGSDSGTLFSLYVAEEKAGGGPLGTPAGARDVVSFLVRSACVGASRWCDEEDVVEEAVGLLR